MKKIITLILTILSLHSFANNAIFDKIITDIDNSILNVQKINLGDKNQLKDLIKSWKKVESSYILLDIDDNYFDTERYIDVFHNTRKSIASQLSPIIKNNESLETEMYKNSYKTINSLEFLIVQKAINSRTKKMLQIIKDSLVKNLQKIKNGYIENKNIFKDNNKIIAYLLSTLATETYKLKEWRIGNVVGLSKKYKTADNKRSEYFLSKNSSTAIISILENQKQILNIAFKNNLKVKKDINNALSIIDKMLKITKSIKNDDLANHPELHKLGGSLLNVYQVTIMNKLDFAAKILDADGD